MGTVTALALWTLLGQASSDDKYAPITFEEPGSPPPAAGTPMERWSDRLDVTATLSTEAHHRMEDRSVHSAAATYLQPVGLSRLDSAMDLGLGVRGTLGRQTVLGRAHLRFRWRQLPVAGRAAPVSDLSHRGGLSPGSLETDALYIQIRDLGFSGLDVTLGEQQVSWGVGDQFNPTNTVNPNDLENVLHFGRQAPNLMARADLVLGEHWTVTGVLAPLFRPALLPPSSEVALAQTDRVPFVDESLRLLLHAGRQLAEKNGYPTAVDAVTVALPDPKLGNVQAGARLGRQWFGQDLSVSFYRGFSDMPVLSESRTRQLQGEPCVAGGPCVLGTLQTDVQMVYPQISVVGFNAAGELPSSVGYRLELAYIRPQAVTAHVYQDEIQLAGYTAAAGELGYPSGEAPLGLSSTPFAKWTLGLDYTFSRALYGNFMWVHGLPDELGAGDLWMHPDTLAIRASAKVAKSSALACVMAQDGGPCADEILRHPIGDYLVAGLDMRFDQDRGLFRLFAIADVTGYERRYWDSEAGARRRERLWPWSSEGMSLVLHPMLQMAVRDGVTIAGGALFQLGEGHTKFGDPAAGGSIAFVRATVGI